LQTLYGLLDQVIDLEGDGLSASELPQGTEE
jgi:hypothetical protein